MGQQFLTLFGKKEVSIQKFQFPKAEDFNLCRPIQVRLPYVKPQSSWMKTIFLKTSTFLPFFEGAAITIIGFLLGLCLLYARTLVLSPLGR